MGTMVKAQSDIVEPLFADGDYQIVNVETGCYLGGSNSWGTQASLLTTPQFFALVDDEDDNTYTLNSFQDRGNGNTYLGTNLYCDSPEADWTIAQNVDGSYTISNDGNYLASDGAEKAVITIKDATAAAAKWTFVSKEDLVAEVVKATAIAPVDATFFLAGIREHSAFWKQTSADGTATPDNLTKRADVAESYHSGNGFDFYQTLTNLPVGTYCLDAHAFYRNDGGNEEPLPYIYVNEQQSIFPKRTGSENSVDAARAAFMKGDYAATPIYFTVTEGAEVKVGVHGEHTNFWHIWGNFHLTYYGTATMAEIEQAKLGEFFTAVEDLVAAAEAIEATYSAEAKAELDAAVTIGEAAMEALTKEALVAAVAPLEAAIARAERSVVINAMDLTLATPAAPIDMTQFVANPDMETGNINGWTATAGWQFQNNNQFANGDAVINNKFQERWVWNAALGNTSTEQTLLDMPNGWYSLTVSIIATRQDAADPKEAATGVYLFAGDEKVAVATKNNTPENFTVKVQVVNNVLTFGIKGEEANANWIAFDNVSLKYLMGDATEEEFELADARAEFLSLKDKFDYFSTGIYEVMYVGRVGDAYFALSETVWALAEKEDATVEEYEACMAEMQKVMDDIVAIDAYYSSTFAPLADECFNVQDNSVATSEEAAAAFEEACDKMGWQGTMNVATVADLEAIVAAVEPVLHEYVQNALPTNGYAFDYTFLAGNVNNSKDGWTWTCDKEGWEGNFAYAEGNTGLNTDEYVKAGFVEVWSPGGYTPEKGYGVLSYEVEVPNGIYTVSAYASSRNVVSKFFANEESVEIAALAKYENPTIENLVVTDGKIKLGIRVDGSDWVGISNVQLSYLGDGGVTAVNLWTEETYIEEWSGEEMEYDLEWDMPELTEIDQTFKFEVDVEAPEGADKTITWSVSNDKVLSIDQTGLLTVIGSGSGFYEVKATAPNGISATCRVKVEAFQEGDITEMEVTYNGEWWVEASKKGATYQLQVTYNEDATNVDLVWSSDNESVATVDQNGLVTIVGSGDTEVRVVAPSGVEASITIWVEILDDDDVDGIKSVESEAKAVIYDLQGRRVQKMEKGLYIVNGKKVLVK